MNSTFLKSALILSVATLVSKILGSIFRIPLQNIAGDEVLGIFSLVYPVYMVALTLSVAGIPVAISKLISEALVHNDKDTVHKIYRTSTILTALFGVLSFTLILSLSGPISEVLGGASTRLALIIVSATLLIAPYMAVYRGYFQGFQDMRPTAISQVLEQFIRVGFILAIAYVLVQRNYSDEIVSGGVMAASFIGALASGIYLLMLFNRSSLKPVAKTKYTFQHFKEMSKKILIISLPICIGAITMALINFVDSITIPMSLRTAGIDEGNIHYTYGIYSRGLALVQIATVFSTSLILPLIPLITKNLAQNKIEETRSVIERTHRMTHLISWPAAFGLLALTLPLNLALFTNIEGSAVLAVIGFSAVFTSLTILGTGILQGMNLEKKASYIIIAGVIVKIVTNIVFIQMFGLIGAGYSTLFVYTLIFLINSFFIWKTIRFTIWTRGITFMVGSAIVMGAVIGLPTLYFQVDTWGRAHAMAYSLVAIVVGALIYFALLLLTKTLKLAELARLPILKKFINKSTSTKQTSTIPERGNGVKDMTKMKKLLWGLLILSLLLSIPGLINRHQVELSNNTYEMVMPYESINELVRKESWNLTEPEVLDRLKDVGLQGVSLEADSLESLEEKGMVSNLTYEDIKEKAFFDPEYEQLLFEGWYDGLVVAIHENNVLTERLDQAFPETDKITFNGKDMVVIYGEQKKLIKQELGYDPAVIDLVRAKDLNLIIRIPNVDLEEDQFLFDQVLTLADENTDRILFWGEEVLGAANSQRNRNEVKQYAELLRDNGFGSYIIEGENQKGFTTLAHTQYMDIVRLHSFALEEAKGNSDVAVDRAVRAVKERNIRSLFLKMDINDKDTAVETLEKTEGIMTGIQQSMPEMFQLGEAEHFEPINVPVWSTAFALLAAVLFVAIAILEIFALKWLAYLAIAGLGIISLVHLILGGQVLVQGLALLVALVTPVFAILPLKGKETCKLLVSYGRGILISSVGIAIIVALLNGVEYLVMVSAFRGVKLIYIFPIAFMFFYAIWVMWTNRDTSRMKTRLDETRLILVLPNLKSLLKSNIKYWHLLIAVIIGAVGFYYLSRTGNQGSVSTIELTIRQLLEEWLYVRPRTKEFLIGFPLYVLALYLLPRKRLVGLFLLVPGVIGFLSIVNTFTHLHIPLYVSILRTAYSLVLGLLIGYILIFIWKKGYSLYEKQVKPRWFT